MHVENMFFVIIYFSSAGFFYNTLYFSLSPQQVENKPCDENTKHAFVLGPTLLVRNRYSLLLYCFWQKRTLIASDNYYSGNVGTTVISLTLLPRGGGGWPPFVCEGKEVI
jgi:hypothetical protein